MTRRVALGMVAAFLVAYFLGSCVAPPRGEQLPQQQGAPAEAHLTDE